jgi:hypothetical protein
MTTVALGQDFIAENWDAKVTGDRVEQMILKAIPQLKARQRLRANLIFKHNLFPRMKEQIILSATEKLAEEKLIGDRDGEMVALVDWNAIFAFLEKLLPLLLQLFG